MAATLSPASECDSAKVLGALQRVYIKSCVFTWDGRGAAPWCDPTDGKTSEGPARGPGSVASHVATPSPWRASGIC